MSVRVAIGLFCVLCVFAYYLSEGKYLVVAAGIVGPILLICFIRWDIKRRAL